VSAAAALPAYLPGLDAYAWSAAQMVDTTATLACLAAALFSYLTLRGKRCLAGRVAVLLAAGLCTGHLMLDDIYDSLFYPPTNPRELAFNYAWTWFEAAVSCLCAAYITLSHAVAAEAYYERKWAESDTIPRRDVRCLQQARRYANRAGCVLMVMVAIAFIQAAWGVYQI
jgi:hypothetical protein